MRSLSRSSSRSNYGRTFELPDDCEDPQSRRTSDYGVGGAMLPVFLNDLSRNSQQEQAQDLVELTIELEHDAVVLCSVSTPTAPARVSRSSHGSRRKFGWLRSGSSSDIEERTISARDERRIKARLQRARSGAKRALNGLRFISKTAGASDAEQLWRLVESRFESLAEDGLLAREDFGECIGTLRSNQNWSIIGFVFFSLLICSLWFHFSYSKLQLNNSWQNRDGGYEGVCGGDIWCVGEAERPKDRQNYERGASWILVANFGPELRRPSSDFLWHVRTLHASSLFVWVSSVNRSTVMEVVQLITWFLSILIG